MVDETIPEEIDYRLYKVTVKCQTVGCLFFDHPFVIRGIKNPNTGFPDAMCYTCGNQHTSYDGIELAEEF